MNENPHGDALSEEAIVRALEGVRARAAKTESQRADLERAIATIQEEERLLQRLLDVRRGVVAESINQEKEAKHDKTPSGSKASSALLPVSASKHPAVQAVIDELATASRPLHISELMRLLRERRVTIPGAGTQANLITHLRRDVRLVRTSRGMYGLSTWGIESMKPSRRVRRRRKRLRATATK